MVIIGFIANLGTFITLQLNGDTYFSSIMLTLLCHQSVVDGLACAMAAILMLQPPNWIPGIYILDYVICHAWNGQTIFWYTVAISVWNLVRLSFEHYLAVVRPFMYKEVTQKKLYMMIAGIYATVVIVCTGTFVPNVHGGW